MIHLSSYHSNGLPAVVWQNKVNLIGEKVYKPKIHFCEQCNKPILIYGRLIPCKHVFCFTCAKLCLTQQQQQQLLKQSTTISTDTDESTSNTSLTNLQQDATNSPNLSGASGNSSQSQSTAGKGCHRCGTKALRVEKNMLNSIYICQVEKCRRTYLSARDLQAHVAHRHNKLSKSSRNTPSASIAAISSSPYISSSTLMHLSNHSNQNSTTANSHQQHNYRHSSSSSLAAKTANFISNNDSPNQHFSSLPTPSLQRHERDHGHHRHYHQDHDRDTRDRHRDRDSKEYHRQSIQRAAQWAEASAQIMEKNLSR